MEQDDEFDADDPGNELRREMGKHKVSKGLIEALCEIGYTASERGITEFGFDAYYAERLIQLVKVAESYGTRDKVPDRLRM